MNTTLSPKVVLAVLVFASVLTAGGLIVIANRQE